MIARRFTARASPANASRYVSYFRETLTPELRKIPGHLGAMVMTRESDGMTDITVLTYWESQESIARFAGATPSEAVVEPEARALFASFDDEVTHHHVALDTLTR